MFGAPPRSDDLKSTPPVDTPATAAVRAALASGAECLTATRRQMHELLRLQATLEQAAGRTVWETARVVPWEAALRRQWTEVDARREALLDEGAARRVWRLIVADSAAGGALLDARAAGRAARQSYLLAATWDVDLATLQPQTPEQEAFLGWAGAYDAYLADNRFIDRARLPAVLAGLPVPAQSRTLWLHGLSPLPGAAARLVAHWRSQGRHVREVIAPVPDTQPVAMRFRTVEEELEGCLAWVHVRLSAQPAARLAVLWPDLQDQSAPLRRLLDDRLYPRALRPLAPPERPYALGSAPALAEYGCVRAALAALALARPVVSAAQLGVALRTPYLAGAQPEASARAQLDTRLRAQGGDEIGSAELERALGMARPAVPEFQALVRTLVRLLGTPGTRALDAWAVAFGQALAAAGWPGERGLASDEYQTVEKFQTALGELASLARVLPPQPLDAALAELTDVARGIEFQPESGTASVVLLDGPAAVGYPLDGLWVGGLDAGRFPSAPLPDPFLPLAAQRRAGIPGAMPRAGHSQALQMLEDWRSWSGELVLSVAATDSRSEQRPSPLLRDVPVVAALPALPSQAARVRAAARLERMPVRPLPALEPGASIVGGSATLEDQSACPFRAALRRRLNVRELQQAAPGVAPTVRGRLAHAALAWLWRELGGSPALARLDAGHERSLIGRAIDAAFVELERFAPRGRLGRLERDWLGDAIARQLATDRERAPFEVVAIEQNYRFDFRGHELSVQLDRLDRLADGRTVLIDYKTGRSQTRRWLAERLEDVQLPLYASHLEQAPAAIVHAHLPLAVRPYAGLASDKTMLPGIGPARGAERDPDLDFDALLRRWRVQTDALAEEFIAGRADVAPTKGACEYCHHHLVCRIALDPADREALAAADADDE